ncbi:hypothetical protein A2971_00915 [Candidatus Gottesmanbacteria bacterium RIFCSPLOWO2_01_FULL_46_21]|uniref:Queuine tRNA-ribosyltransferase n=1 Tax=Candidatus Gottesmanbacteria bacterium RIFCSPLOWO2_01_FULL_46_21 TaxID=1798393 RepID=A0A1F6AY41_9BACT|nr:MAG: hypothetical protein A2971_00915 [Candidatus Gottesmanbacteria bacterium RIFCSPLOWO2_01_FULL_46_21]
MFRFKVLHKDKKTNARVGEIVTPHGVIRTPAFVPVGTQATVKSLTPEELDTLGVQLFFVNTYHMYLRPGIEVIEKLGGLHKFMGWKGPVITDSGGFQVFSLGAKKSDDGVEFRSHWDGTSHVFTPEKSIEIQKKLGADIILAFDDCTPYPVTHGQARRSLSRTHAWATRSLDAHLSFRPKSRNPEGKTWIPGQARDDKTNYQALYGSIQGSVYEDLRKESAEFIGAMDFDGIAIGGVAVGESKKEMVDVLDWVGPILPDKKPRHLLGVGEIDDIFALVERGIDTFDCVQPTRLARMGKLMGKPAIDITKKQYARDLTPIEGGFSRAYLHHLFRVHELLGYRLATIHNLHFVHRLVDDIRESITKGSFLELKDEWI